MASDREYKQLMSRLATLERIARNSHRMGVVHKVENGRHRVKFQAGDGGDEDGDDTSPWIRTGHGGAMSEDRQYSEGETVHVFAPGGNLEHAYIVPGGFSDNQPQDGNSKKDNSTRRWRKPPEDDKGGDQGGGSAGGGGSGGGSGGGAQGQYGADKSKAKKWKDDEKDHQETTTWDKRWHKIGDTEYTVTADGGELKHGKRSVKVTKDSAILTDGSATITVKGGKVTIKADSIVLDGTVDLGGEGGKPLGIEGTVDNRGDRLTSNFATKVRAK